MKKNMIVGIAMAMGMLSIGAISASAADTCGKCVDKQVVSQFTQETATLTDTLKAKDLELRGQYSNDSIDIHKVNALESEIKELKDKINATANKYGIPTCCRS